MLGIIVCGVDEAGEFNEAVYHKFGNATIFEHTVDNALKCEFAQKVVVCAPASERRNIKGSGIYPPLIKGDRSYLGRKALFHFYTDADDTLSGLYHAALSYGLDHVVLIRAHSPILPAWLINRMIYTYMKDTNQNVYMHNHYTKFGDSNPVWYGKGLEVSILPFWLLAERHLYAEDRHNLDFTELDEALNMGFKNQPGTDDYLPNSKMDLRFTDLERREEFDFLLTELAKGADLGELIEDLNEPEKSQE